MRCFYVLKKLSLNRDLSLNKMSLNRDCTVLITNSKHFPPLLIKPYWVYSKVQRKLPLTYSTKNLHTSSAITVFIFWVHGIIGGIVQRRCRVHWPLGPCYTSTAAWSTEIVGMLSVHFVLNWKFSWDLNSWDVIVLMLFTWTRWHCKQCWYTSATK